MAAARGSSLRLRLASADGTLPRVVAAADGCGFPVRDVSVDQATLETVFIELTGRALRE